MKKFYTLLALCLAGIMSMTAKDYYTLDGLNESAYPSVAEIQTGVDYFIGNARTNAESYLCTTGGTGSLSSACLYQFEEAGKDKEGTTTYFIKNVETGQYMGEDPSTYTSSRTRATQFTIMPGKVFNATPNPESGAAPYTVDWANVDYDARNATSDYDTNGNFILADDFNPLFGGTRTCWVFCIADSKETGEDGLTSATYLSTYGGANFMGYRDTNCWGIYKPAKLTGNAAMIPAFNDILGGVEFNPDDYVAGSGLGEYSQEAIDNMTAAWEVFADLLNNGEGSDEECNAAIAQLQAAFDALQASMGTLQDGQYYRFWNWRDSWTGCVYEADSQVKWTPNYVSPDEIDVEDTKYIWKLEVIDGKNYFKNYYTGHYMSDAASFSNAFPVTVEPTTSFAITASDLAGSFNIRGDERATNWGMHSQTNGNVVVYWNAGSSENNQGSLWKLEAIDAEIIQALEEKMEQTHKNQKLTELLNEASDTYNKGFSYTQYLTDVSQITANRTETSEGGTGKDGDPKELALIDGNYNTFYHSFWSQQGDLGQPHWFQVATEEPIKDFALDVVRRGINSNQKGAVTRWLIAGTNDASLAETDDYTPGDLAATLDNYKSTWDAWQIVEANYDQSVTYNGASYNNAKATFTVNLSQPCQYIRVMALVRMADTVVADTVSTDPLEVVETITYGDKPADNIYMCIGELVMRSIDVDPNTSLINAVPAEIRQALETAMEKAQTELASQAATDATIAELQKAYDDFLENFPEPQVLRDLLEDAQGWIDETPIGDEVGYFPEGATAELESVVEQVSATVKDVMTMDEINAGKKAINDAIANLQSKLIYPEEGIYMIQSTTEGAAANNYVRNWYSGDTQLSWGGAEESVEPSSHPGYFWKLTKNEDGTWSLFNYGTGNYLQAQPEETSPVLAGAAKSSFTMRSARLGGSFNIVFGENNFMNADPNTGGIVTWGSAKGADNSSFQFVEASEEWKAEYGFYYEPGTPRIITLPFDIVNDCVEPLYKLVGTFNNAFQFDYYATDEVIPAGTPVVYYSESDEYENDIFSTVASDLTELTYTNEAKTQNGLIGTIVGIDELPVGSGIFWKAMVVASEEGEGLYPNSGYLLVSDDCGRVGELSIPYEEGVGTLTGISNVAVKNNISRGIYNLQGQKMQGKLNSGLYIINGKKYIVK